PALGGPASRWHMDRELMSSAVAEVIRNGLEASADGGVTVVARSDARGLIGEGRGEGGGMSARALNRAFDPFFAEKPAWRGTGVGLTRARRLVELHGGEIAVWSEGGKGTTAVIRLPRDSSAGAVGSKTEAVRKAA